MNIRQRNYKIIENMKIEKINGNQMGNSLLVIRDIKHKYIIVGKIIKNRKLEKS